MYKPIAKLSNSDCILSYIYEINDVSVIINSYEGSRP